MPKYKFDWSNLEPSLRRALCRALLGIEHADEDPAVVLKTAAAVGPTEEFIRYAYPKLRESWLRAAKESRESVVEALMKARGERNTLSSRDAQMGYA